MKKLLILLLIGFTQCKKDKDEKPAPDLSTGLLAYFSLDGKFKDSADDLDVSYGGLLSWVKNRYGYSDRALSCNGGLFSFETPHWRAKQITVSLWVKPHDFTHDNYLILSDVAAFGMYQKQSKIGFAIANPDTAIALAEIKLEWTHVAGTFDGKDIKTFINGKLAATVAHPGVPDITSMIGVGAWHSPEWKGVVDDVRFYNRVLSAEEIRLLTEL